MSLKLISNFSKTIIFLFTSTFLQTNVVTQSEVEEYHERIFSKFHEASLRNHKLACCIRIIWKDSWFPLNTHVNDNSVALVLNRAFNFSAKEIVFDGKYNEMCTFIMHHYMGNFIKESILPFKSESQLSGGYLESYHIIFHKNIEYEALLTKLPNVLQLLVHRIFVSVPAVISSTSIQDEPFIWQCTIRGERCQQLETNSDNDSWITMLTSQTLDFKNQPLVWVSPYFPHVNQKAINHYLQNRENIDLYLSPMVEISESLNATPILKVIQSQNYGTFNKKLGKWSGAAAKVINGEADATVGMLITPDRYNYLILSKTIDSDGLTFITGPLTLKVGSSLFLLEAYTWEIWACLIGVMIILTLLMRLAYEMHFDSKNNSILQYIILVYILNPLLEQPLDSKYYNKFLKTKSFVFIIGPWLLSLVVLGTLYKTNLISNLTSPNFEIPPSTWKGLIDSDYQLSFLGINLTAGVIFNEVKKKGNRVARSLDERIVAYYNADNGEECVKKIFAHHHVCLGIRNMLQQYAFIHLTNSYGQSLFRFGNEVLSTTFYAFGISKSLPHLKCIDLQKYHQFDLMMYHYAESGSYLHFINLLKKKTVQYGKLEAKKRIKEKHEFNAEPERKRNDYNRDTGTIRTFIILGIGFGLAVIVFVLEFIFHWVDNLTIKK